MNTEKIIGYLLLVAGIGIILASTFSLYQVFTAQKQAPQIFSFEMPAISLPSVGAKIKVLPDEMVNTMANMGVYLLLMGFLAASGAKIAGIGVKMIKDIKVVVKGTRDEG